MEQKIKISVIMPVYNTPEEFLREAVRSVLNQSYENLQLIIVDDGSKSECAMICDAIGKIDTRILVLHQNNAGVSKARNVGTQVATGDYVMYVDSDDFLGAYALEEGVSVIYNTCADFVFAAIQHISELSQFMGKKSNIVNNYILYDNKHIDDVRHAFLTQSNPMYKNIGGVGFVNRGPYARLVKTDIANRVRFNVNLKIGEDVEWNMRLLNTCSSVAFVSNIWYGYLIYGNSSLRKYYGNRAELLKMYHEALYANNKEYCNRHPEDYAFNMAVSFYSLVQFEYLSPESTLGKKETNREIQNLLNQEPWTILTDKRYCSSFPTKYRVFIQMCKCGTGSIFLKLWNIVTFHKKELR